MADIFISYSKADRDLTVTLAAFLEAEGWTVWWDKSLQIADSFRDEIMKELAKARAVITIWTETSITSDWVRAEAGRAKADGKLIPLKTSSVAYGDIPLPFGEMHIEDVSKTELVRAAVVAQLAKPAVTPTALRTTVKTLRYQVLTWGGVVGGAITLFNNLGGGGIFELAKWAKAFVAHLGRMDARILGVDIFMDRDSSSAGGRAAVVLFRVHIDGICWHLDTGDFFCEPK